MAGVSVTASYLNFKYKLSQNAGFVDSLEEAHELIKKFETKTTTKFCCFKVEKGFGAIGK